MTLWKIKWGGLNCCPPFPCKASLSPAPPARRVGVGGCGFPNQIEISLELSVMCSVCYCVDIMNLWFSASDIYLTVCMGHCIRKCKSYGEWDSLFWRSIGVRKRIRCVSCSLNACNMIILLKGNEAVGRFLCHSRGRSFHSINLHRLFAMSWCGLVQCVIQIRVRHIQGTPHLVGRTYFLKFFVWKQPQSYRKDVRLRMEQRIMCFTPFAPFALSVAHTHTLSLYICTARSLFFWTTWE